MTPYIFRLGNPEEQTFAKRWGVNQIWYIDDAIDGFSKKDQLMFPTYIHSLKLT